jgi:hypothetical protein
MTPINQCGDQTRGGALPACECVWICARGGTRLCCQLRNHSKDDVEIEVVRNGRLYGTYRFVERVAAIIFATRLRLTFEGNGWITA